MEIGFEDSDSLVEGLGPDSLYGAKERNLGGRPRKVISESLAEEVSASAVEEEFEVELEIGADVELISESTPGVSAESELIPSEMPPEGWLKWGELQENILEALIQDEDEWDGPEVAALSKRLRCEVGELQHCIQISNPDQVQARRLEKLLELESLRKRGFNWDRVENAALAKIIGLVEKKNLTTGEYLQIARVANAATRRGPGGEIMDGKPHAPGTQVNVQLNQYGQPIESDGGLPGPGSIGRVTLSLSQRTMNQLSKPKTIEGEVVRLADSAEMLTSTDIPQLSKLADGET